MVAEKKDNKQAEVRFEPGRYLAPRYWGTWMMMAGLYLTTRLPYRAMLWVGAGFGYLLYLLMAKRRHIVRTNFEWVFPELSAAEQRQLMRENFVYSGQTFVEMALSWWGSKQRLQQLSHIKGLEHLVAAKERGKGVILMSGHFTCFELAARMVSDQVSFQVLYKEQRKNPLFEAFSKSIRQRYYEASVQHHDIRGMIKGLKAGRVCWYLPDQDYGRNNSVFAPFMGHQAATVTATARLAKMTGAAVVPFFPRRKADGRGYEIEILPALEGFPSGDEVADATRINEVIEPYIRRNPEQYLWLHRRFHTRPEGEPDPYQ